MARYTFNFLSPIGQVCDQQLLDFADDSVAMEMADIFDHVFGVRVYEGEREVGTMWPISRSRIGLN